MSRLFKDQIGRTIAISEIPKRIISLVPSITELLYDLGLEANILGRTTFCVHPAALQSVTKVGSTKKVHYDRIAALTPDLIIANKEENDKVQVEYLAERYPTWVSDVPHFDAAMDMIYQLGTVLGKEAACQAIIAESIQFKAFLGNKRVKKAAYLIWYKPYMTIGKDTYIHDLLRLSGFTNIFASQTRYPICTIEEIKSLHPEIILLSSEPFPFKEQHIAELAIHFPNIPIKLVDGEAFSWYGTRFLETYEYLMNL